MRPPTVAIATCAAHPEPEPALLELELVEPSLYLDFAPGSPEALARALVRCAGGGA